MRELHESGLFFYKRGNGLLTTIMPAVVRSFKVHLNNGKTIESFIKKAFYFQDMEILEVNLEDGEKKFFQYRAKKGQFVEIDEEDISSDY